MKRKIFLYIAMGALVVCTACNKAQESSTSPQTTAEQQDRPQGENRGNMTIAKVTFVTDHSINVVTADMPQRDNTQKPSDENTEKPTGENSEKPTGERPADNGDRPKGERGNFKMDTSKLEFSTDETLIEIPDESIIFKIEDNTEIGCSLSDIKEGDILQIRYNSDGVTPEKITINNASEKAE